MCKVEWCNNKQIINNSDLCRNHYNQMKRYGKILEERPRGKRNEYIVYNDYAKLNILDKNGNIKITALVDIDDVDKLKRYSFRYDTGKYIKAAQKGKTKYLHRIVLNYDGDMEVDHINRNKLDNRKSNLRIVDRKTNANNIYRKETNSIVKVKRNLTKPYLLRIKRRYIGYYETLEEAIKVRDKYTYL